MQRLIGTFWAMLVVAAAMVGGLGYYVQRTTARMSHEAARALRENCDSIDAMDRIRGALAREERFWAGGESGGTAGGSGLAAVARDVEAAAAFESGNITVPGEAEAASRLRGAVDRYAAALRAAAAGAATAAGAPDVATARAGVESASRDVARLNRAWMERRAREQADGAPRHILAGTLAAVAGLLAAGYSLAGRLRRQARELQAMRSHFVAIASHELRTPVTSLRMGLDLLAGGAGGGGEGDEPDAEERRAIVAAGLEDCDRLLSLSRQLLDVTKIESGQLEFRPSAIDPRPLLADAVKAMLTSFREKRVTMDLDLDGLPAETRVMVDPVKTGWVVTNLLANALRYSAPGATVRLSARLAAAGAGGGLAGFARRREVAVSVSDTGPGIAPEAAGRVFQPYYQSGGGGGAGGTGGGAGLGLAIAREIVAGHGGRIRIEPVPMLGRGTTVTFTIPVAAEQP